MRLLSTLLLIFGVVAGVFAAGLYWEQTYGSCADGCPQGMVFVLFLPAVAAAVAALLGGLILRRMSARR